MINTNPPSVDNEIDNIFESIKWFIWLIILTLLFNIHDKVCYKNINQSLSLYDPIKLVHYLPWEN